MKTFDTERLHLRPFVLADAEDLHREIYSDIEVVRYYSGKGVLTLEQTRQHLAGHILGWEESECGRLAVFLTDGGQFLGQVHLNLYVNSFGRWPGEPDSPYNPLEVELAFAFGRRYWGKGYAYETCQAMIRYAFDELKLARLVGGVMTQNTRSINLHRRLGYRVERNLLDSEYVTILENNAVGPVEDRSGLAPRGGESSRGVYKGG
jgi:ribosomal-protein-alanine N-acetyltransferase